MEIDMIGTKKDGTEKNESEYVIAFGTKSVQIEGGGRAVSLRLICLDGREHGILLMPQQVRGLRDDLNDLLDENAEEI